MPRPSGEGDLLAFAAREPVVPADCLRLHLSVEVTIYGNLPRPYFVNLLRCARLLAGNSSAGLLEAPSVPLAVVNIGRRQRGRRAAGNVVFADADGLSIRAAIDTALSPAFQHALRSVVNPYGDGRSAPRACELLKTIDFPSLLRKTEDPLRPDQGQ